MTGQVGGQKVADVEGGSDSGERFGMRCDCRIMAMKAYEDEPGAYLQVTRSGTFSGTIFGAFPCISRHLVARGRFGLQAASGCRGNYLH